jgi:hypothetical protein
MAGSAMRSEETLNGRTPDYRRTAENPRDSFGLFKFGQSLALLGTITRDSQIMEEAIAVIQRFLAVSGADGENHSRGSVLTECGELCVFMGQLERAEVFLDAATKEESTDPLPHIFLARVKLLMGMLPQARSALRDALPMTMSDANRMDFAFVAGEIALKSTDENDVKFARERLEACNAEGIFEARRIDLLQRLSSPRNAVPPRELPWWRTALKYVKLEPSVAGVGLKLDKLFEAAADRRK